MLLVAQFVVPCTPTHAAASGNAAGCLPILVYHRFGPTVADSMTVTTATFAAQLEFLSARGYTVIPLRQLIDFRLGKSASLPPRAVVLTADDGHRSVYTEMRPLVIEHRVPVTLFIYPSAISNATYALTWQQLRELQAAGRFDVQSHSYWHPNFRVEKRRLSPEQYERFAIAQFARSRATLRTELGIAPDVLAWPFGIFDPELASYARAAGFVAGVTIERHHVQPTDDLMALPRYLITDSDRGAAFARLLEAASCPSAHS